MLSSPIHSTTEDGSRRRHERRDDRLSHLLRFPKWGGLAVALVLLTGVTLTQFGPMVSPDSIQYLSAARNFAAGQGIQSSVTPLEIMETHVPFGPGPPLYPVMIGGLIYIGLSPLDAARVLNLFFLVAMLIIIGPVARLVGGRHVSNAALLVHAIMFYPFLAVTFVWSEIMFTTFTLFSLFFAGRGLRMERPGWSYFIAGLFAAGAVLTRYVGGLTIVVTGVGLLLLRSGVAKREAFKETLCYWIPAAVPGLAWLVRNQIVTGFPLGEPISGSAMSLDRSLMETAVVFFRDLLAPSARIEAPWIWAGWACGVAGILTLTWATRRNFRKLQFPGFGAGDRFWLLILCLLGLYLGSVIVAFAVTDTDPINTRYLMPVYPLAMILGVVGFKKLVFSERRRQERARRHRALSLALTLLAVPQILTTVSFARTVGNIESQSLTYPYWMTTLEQKDLATPDPGLVTLQQLCTTEDLIISNRWELIGVMTGIPCKPLPVSGDSIGAGRLLEFHGAVVAIHRPSRAEWMSAQQLHRWAETTPAIRPLGESGEWSFFRIHTADRAAR